MVEQLNFPAFENNKKKFIYNKALKIWFNDYPPLKTYINENISEIISKDETKISVEGFTFDILKTSFNGNYFYIVNIPSYNHICESNSYYENIQDFILDYSLQVFGLEHVSIFKMVNKDLCLMGYKGKNILKKKNIRFPFDEIPEIKKTYLKRVQTIPTVNSIMKFAKVPYSKYNYIFIPLYHLNYFYGILLYAGKTKFLPIRDKLYNISDLFGKFLFEHEQSIILQILGTLKKEFFSKSYLFDDTGYVLFPFKENNKHIRDFNLDMPNFENIKKLLKQSNPCISTGHNDKFYIVSKHTVKDKNYYFIGEQNRTSKYFNYNIDINYQSVLSKFFADAPFGLFVQVNDQINFYNKQFLEMFPKFLSDKNVDFFALMHKFSPDKVKNYKYQLLKEGHLNTRLDIIRNNSNYVYNVFLNHFNNNFGDHIIGIIVDITKMAVYEQEIIELKKRETLQNLSSIIGNQINNLLQPIVGYTSYLKMISKDNSEIREIVSKIEQSTIMATDLIRRVPIKIRKPGESIDLFEECKNIIEIIELIKQENIKIYYTGGKNNYCSLISSSDFNQIMLNLIYNSLEAIQDKGEIKISFANIHITDKEKIRIYDLKDRDFIHINIKDSGKGIPNDVIRQVFKPFFTTKQGGHSGLGLSMVLEIIENNNGFIEISSKKKMGTNVNIYLPQYPCDKDKSTLAIKEHKTIHVQEMLIIEDNSIVSSFMDSILNELHIKHYISPNAKNGISYLKAHPHSISHIYIDFNIIDIPIIEAYKELHKIDGKAKYIISSGYFNPEKLHNLLKLNNDILILKKPFDYNTFLKAIKFN